ncbi:MAG: hypothetical protein MUE50_26110 [Pirellulaceae bacterium]|jgi:histidinol phosphatase-like enzyme|nr:hypothetical protein [Pirellulaceae bacterium]
MFRRWKLSRRRRLEKGPWVVSVLGFATLVVLNAIRGADLDAVAYCPHGPDEGCGCRKPRTGLAREVERQRGQSIDYAASWTIGDKLSDLGFGMLLTQRE